MKLINLEVSGESIPSFAKCKLTFQKMYLDLVSFSRDEWNFL